MNTIHSRRLLLMISVSILAAGCATPQNPDPMEALNRKTFAFNEGVDKALLKPTATVYRSVVPEPVRNGIANFFRNLSDPWSSINLVLQGRLKESLTDLARFGVNTTFGVLGLIDVATGWGLQRHGQDFSDTLGVWGVGGGAYLVLPLFGPSDIRGLASLPVNGYTNLQLQIRDLPVRNSLMALSFVDTRTQMLEVTKLIDDVALDKYLFVRDAFLQRRANRNERDAVLETVPPDQERPASNPIDAASAPRSDSR